MRFGPAICAVATGVAFAFAAGGASAQIINSTAGQVQPQDGQLRLFDPARIVVKFVDGADPAAVMAAAVAGDRESYREGGAFDFAEQATGATLVDLSASIRETESNTGRFGVERPDAPESARNQPLDQLIERLNDDPQVEYAQKNYLAQPYQADLINDIIDDRRGPNDPYYGFQWHLKRHGAEITETTAPGAVDFPGAWQKYQSRRQVVVAVIDTGQLFDHDDVNNGLLLPGYDFIADPFVSNDGDGRDADPTDVGDAIGPDECYQGDPGNDSSWHGSHVSGIAGLAVNNNEVGIASPVPSGIAFLPLRVLGRCGGYDTDIVDAMLWAVGIDVPGVPSNPNPATVINMSLGGPSSGCDPIYQDAMRQIRAAGAVAIVSAGNSSADSIGFSPASCSDAVTVAASDMMGALAPYSNYGAAVDILAPGGDISQDLDGNEYVDGVLSIVDGGYSFYNGTSMAAPVVAAAVAMALSHNPAWTPDDAVNRMTATAMPRSASECAEPCGAGLLNAVALLD